MPIQGYLNYRLVKWLLALVPILTVCDGEAPSPSETVTITSPPAPTPILTPTPTAELTIHFTDVGQGDSVLVDLGEANTIKMEAIK